MNYVLAVDPGLVVTGLAEFRCGILTEVDGVFSTAKQDWPTRLERIGNRVTRFVAPKDGWIVMEWPQVYGQGGAKASPRALLDVAAAAGAVAASCGLTKCIRVKPAEWKGQVPKESHNERVLARLSQDEKAVFERWVLHGPAKENDVIDAIGIGLWAIGRMKGPKLFCELAG